MSFSLRKYLFMGCALIGLGGCASSPEAPSSVLEPVTETAVPPPSLDAMAPKPSEALIEKLRELGYQGVGLEFESAATLELLTKVFSSPEARGLDLKLIYTGGRMQYDASQKSLTIGGSKDAAAIIAFLKKSVPHLKSPVTPSSSNQ